MDNFKLTTPVVFIIFNRPEVTTQVFAAIAKVKPPKLLIVADGPRLNRANDGERVAQTRAVIDKVDWPCEVFKNYSEINMGCRKRVSSGIDWVFDTVDEAIILEDDCLPDSTFFRFCEEMLTLYRDDSRVGMITGDNFQFGRQWSQDSYYFSKHVHIWGWATWKNRWKDSYDEKMYLWPTIRDSNRVVDLVLEGQEVGYWKNVFENVHRGIIDTWDYQWIFSNWIQGRKTIIPTVNLVSNIGYGADATHTTVQSDLANLPISPIQFPLKHPTIFAQNKAADLYFHKNHINPQLFRRLCNRIKRFFLL